VDQGGEFGSLYGLLAAYIIHVRKRSQKEERVKTESKRNKPRKASLKQHKSQRKLSFWLPISWKFDSQTKPKTTKQGVL
jgi:hypothetical protein